MGDSTEASGKTSTAMGTSTIASGDTSTAMGRNTRTGFAQQLYDASQVVKIKGPKIYNLLSPPFDPDAIQIMCARI